MSSRRWKCVRVARSLKCLLDSLPSDLFQIAAPVPAMRLEVEQKGALKLTTRDLLTDAGAQWCSIVLLVKESYLVKELHLHGSRLSLCEVLA